MRKKRDVLWSELLPDCCTKIFACLGSVDQLAFRGVCKSWRAAALSAPPQEVKQLFVMYKATSKFYAEPDPEHIYNFVDYSSLTLSAERPVYSRSFPNLHGCSFLTAKHGWLLVGRPVFRSVVSTFFYDPFSCSTINLPTFLTRPVSYAYDLGENRLRVRFDFIGPPTSPDCLVMAVFFVESFGWLWSTTCRRGQSAWAPPTFYRNFKTVWLPPTQMVFHEGSFYCVSSRDHVGKVLAFSPETNTINPFSGHPRQVEEAWNYKSPFKKVLCDLIDAGMASDLVDRLGGVEVLRSRSKRESSVKVCRLPRVEGKMVTLGEVETGFPHYRPFLQMEEGQLLVFWYAPGIVLGNRAWIHKRWVKPGTPTDLHLQWAPSMSQSQVSYKTTLTLRLIST